MRAARRGWLLAAAAVLAAPAAWAAAAAGVSAWPALSARYRVSVQRPGQPAAVQLWTLSRSADRIAFAKGPVEDLWSRDGRGAVGLQRVLREDRHVIEYSPGELRTLGIAADWNALATLFDEARIPALAAKGQLRRGGRTVARYGGRLGDETVDLQWDGALRLPVRLVRSSAAATVQFELLETHGQAPADWPVPGAGSEGFLRIDAADFGDMESNPVVRKAQALDVRAGWRSGHAH